MIPARGNYVAHFNAEDPSLLKHARPVRKIPVEAWGPQGEPMIASQKGLIPATSLASFSHIEDTEHGAIVGVIPGGGWRLRHTGHPDNEELVVAWLVGEDGYGLPLMPWASGDEGEHVALAIPVERGYVLIDPREEEGARSD